MPAKTKDSETLKNLAKRIEEEATRKTDEVFLKAKQCAEGFSKREGVSVNAFAWALINESKEPKMPQAVNYASLYEEVKMNIINEIVKQAKEAKTL